MQINRCVLCQRQIQMGRQFCRRCTKELIATGRCRYCGAPATTMLRADGTPTACEPCTVEIVAVSEARQIEVRPAPPQPTFRDRDARENQRETRGGR